MTTIYLCYDSPIDLGFESTTAAIVVGVHPDGRVTMKVDGDDHTPTGDNLLEALDNALTAARAIGKRVVPTV